MTSVGLSAREAETVFSPTSVLVTRISAKPRSSVSTLVLLSVTEVPRKLTFMPSTGLPLASVTLAVMVAPSVVLTTNEYTEVKEASFAVPASAINVTCFVSLTP